MKAKTARLSHIKVKPFGLYDRRKSMLCLSLLPSATNLPCSRCRKASWRYVWESVVNLRGALTAAVKTQ